MSDELDNAAKMKFIQQVIEPCGWRSDVIAWAKSVLQSDIQKKSGLQRLAEGEALKKIGKAIFR